MEEFDVDDPSPLPSTSSTSTRPSNSNRPTSDSSLGLGRTKRQIAVVWKYFQRSGLNPAEGKCNKCGDVLKLKTGSTTSMIRHLEGKHPDIYKEYINEQKQSENKKLTKQPKLSYFKQPKINDLLTSGEKWPPHHPKAKLITNSITRWMAKSLHPYSLVQEEGFVDLMKLVEPKYKVPCRTTFSRSLIPELYLSTKNRVEEDIKTNLEKGLNSVAISSDLWTSSANDSFLSVNAHFVDDSFSLKTHCLANAHFEDEHNGRNIAGKLKQIVEQQYGLRPQTVRIFGLTDNASNMVSAMTLVEDWTHFRCFAHTLQLALNDAKKDVTGMLKMLSKARAIVGHYKHSSTAQSRLNKLQLQLGLQPLHLVQDCETRWNSEFHMLSRLIELKQPLSADLANVEKIENLNSNEWELAEGYVIILKPLESATTAASSSALPTLSSVLPILDGIKAVLRNYIQAGKKGLMFARALEKSIKSRFPDGQYLMKKEYVLAMTIDPRYKTVILDDEHKRVAKDLLQNEAVRQLEKLKQKESMSSSSTAATGEESCETQKGTQDQDQDQTFSLWHHFQSRSGTPTCVVTSVAISNQVDAFLSSPTIDLKEDPCKWWKMNACMYSFLAPIAKMYLGVPATEVESERVFSSAGNVVSERRRRLKQEHISELVFLHHNI
ncbi:zinc finger BED domain-containing protein 4-like [Macrosteles quadrilineatus]|uniref:zinc finger BED domain-containing protein 4-like n=1 Tax=Macrosteles quadrilineatus TaxID=74068 RepID=UPI0023E196ED|nr:zinc finger BED domain-containing protein 4-like [Macrosteles quadrilineatus]